MPGDDRSLDAKSVEERNDVSREVLDAVADRWLVRVAVAALGDGDDPNRRGSCAITGSYERHESVGPGISIKTGPDGSRRDAYASVPGVWSHPISARA